jgi:hypothetical protein
MEHIHHEHSPCEDTTPGADHGTDHAHEEPQPDGNYETGEDPPTAA